MRVAVVGAGIVGLATAFELSRAPAVEVRCYERSEPMAARSVGDTRIFRLGHADPALVELALQAEAGWQRWSDLVGSRLIAPTSTVLSGPPAPRWHRSMTEAGAPSALSDDAAGLGLPSRNPGGPFLVDHRGGIVDVRTTGTALRAGLGSRLRTGDEVTALAAGSPGVRVDSTSGRWDCDAVIVAAGAGTPTLAAAAGISGIPTNRRHHHRFTFRLTDATTSPPCWLDQTGAWRDGYTTYQHVSAAGHWAIGGSLDAGDTAWELDEAESRRRALAAVRGYLEATSVRVEPEVVDVVHCDSMGLGDGIGFGRAGSVYALWGDNLMKFAPALGSMLAAATRDEEAVRRLTGLDRLNRLYRRT